MNWLPSAEFEPAGTDGRKDLASREFDLAKLIGDILFQAYPGYLWAVQVDLHGKYKAATVQLPVLMPARLKYSIPARYLCTYNDLRRVTLRAGGEILERYRVPRSGLKFGHDAFLAARSKSILPGNKQVPA